MLNNGIAGILQATDQIVMIPYNANSGKVPPWDLLGAFSPESPT